MIHESWQDGWIVDGGLSPGERIVVEGIMKVNPGMKVIPLTREEQAARNAQSSRHRPGRASPHAAQ